MDIFISFILGIIEGITEWLPISSTGHMILFNQFVQMKQSPEFMDMYLVVIQLGAILAVVILFWNQLWPFSAKEQYYIKKDTWVMWFKIVVACIPAVIVELAFGDQLERWFYNYQTVSVMLILVGIVFIVIENRKKTSGGQITEISQISYKLAFMVGMFQLVAAVFPGTSRSGATIIGGLMLGMSRTLAAEFTFYLAVPVMFGASFMKLLKFGFAFTTMEAIVLAVGMITALVVSLLVIRFLMGYIKKHDFKVFGWYRIILGALVLVYFAVLAYFDISGCKH